MRIDRYKEANLCCAIGAEDVQIFVKHGAARLVFFDGPISEFSLWIDGIHKNVLAMHDGEYSLARVMEEVYRILIEGDTGN